MCGFGLPVGWLLHTVSLSWHDEGSHPNTEVGHAAGHGWCRGGGCQVVGAESECRVGQRVGAEAVASTVASTQTVAFISQVCGSDVSVGLRITERSLFAACCSWGDFFSCELQASHSSRGGRNRDVTPNFAPNLCAICHRHPDSLNNTESSLGNLDSRTHRNAFRVVSIPSFMTR